MLVGYARTSTSEQIAGLEAQLRDLAATGCTEKVFSGAGIFRRRAGAA
jgi:DNA invertase Pin-like site-specific DNA recombinase